MVPFAGLLAAALAVAAVDWWAVAASRRRLEYVCKPAVVVVLLSAALVVDPADPAQRRWFVVALAAALAGDVLLMLPSDRFLPGLVAFLAAHLAYIGGFAQRLDVGWLLLVAAVLVAVGAATVGRAVVTALGRSSARELLPAVFAYMGVVSAMALAAGATGLPLALAGAALFYGSDALIAWNRFVQPLRWAPVAIIVTYHLAQLALVASLAG